MIRKFKTYIEREPWDEGMNLFDDVLLKPMCWGAIIVAVVYFGPVCLKIFLRGGAP